MKKIIVAMAAFFIMLCTVASPLFIKPIYSYAAYPETNSVEGESIPYEDKYADFDNWVNYKNWQNWLNDDSKTYVKFNTYSNIHRKAVPGITNDTPRTFSFCLWFNSAKDYELTEDSFTIDFDETIELNYYSQGNYYIKTYQYNGSTIHLEFTSTTWQVNGEDIYTAFNGDPSPSSWIRNFDWETNGNVSTGGLDVDVDFTPDLVGNITRQTVSDNGASSLSKYFSMDITNNCNFGIQYRMAIIDSGDYQYAELDSENPRQYTPNYVTGYSMQRTYGQALVNDEWIYVNPEGTAGVVKTLKASEWHYIGAKSSIHQDLSWSQFNIQKDHSYTVYVLAVPNNLGCASALDSQLPGMANNYSDFCVDYTGIATVYSSTFTITNPAEYNPNDTSFGNRITHDGYNGEKYKTSAFEDPETGELVISNRDLTTDFRDVLGTPRNGGSHGGGGYYTNTSGSYNYSYGPGSNFNTLNSYFSNFFGFCNAALASFPAVFLTIITAGLAGLVVLGIVKVALK